MRGLSPRPPLCSRFSGTHSARALCPEGGHQAAPHSWGCTCTLLPAAPWPQTHPAFSLHLSAFVQKVGVAIPALGVVWRTEWWQRKASQPTWLLGTLTR